MVCFEVADLKLRIEVVLCRMLFAWKVQAAVDLKQHQMTLKSSRLELRTRYKSRHLGCKICIGLRVLNGKTLVAMVDKFTYPIRKIAKIRSYLEVRRRR